MTKIKRKTEKETNWQQNTTQKAKYGATRTPLKRHRKKVTDNKIVYC